MTLGYVNLASAAPTPKVCPGHPSCKPVPSNAIIYTAGVTGGVFQFAAVTVTLNELENSLYPDPDATLTFSRPEGAFPCNPGGSAVDKDACAWDAVFDECPELLGPTVVRVNNFTVDEGTWWFDEPGDRRVSFQDIEVSNIPDGPVVGKIWLQLIGPKETPIQLVPRDDSGALKAGESRTILMTRFLIIGRSLKGQRPKRTCQPKGTGAPDTGVPDTLNLKDEAQGNLVITASCPAGTVEPYCAPE